MIYISAEMKGLDFETWQDAFHQSPPNSILGDPRLDDLPAQDLLFLGLEYQYRLAGEMKVQDTRGVGNHRSPEVMIVGDSLKCKMSKKNSPFWQVDPRYRRIRAFSHDRQFLYLLLDKCDSWQTLSKYYVTIFNKNHLIQSNFEEELKEVRPKNILCFDREVFIAIIEMKPKSKIRLIEKPHKKDWRSFYTQVKEFLVT